MSLGPAFWTRAAVEGVDDLRNGLADFDFDAHRDRRLKVRECKACFYLKRGRIAGQAFTAWRCDFCDAEPPMHHNTAVPRVCELCSVKHDLCTRCSGDIHMDKRRTDFPPTIDRRQLRRRASHDSTERNDG